MPSNDGLRSASFLIVIFAIALASGSSASRAQGHGFGGPHLSHGISAHGGGRGGIGRARVAVYDVVTVSNVTDATGLKTTLAKLGPSLTGTGGRVLVDTDDPTTVTGTTRSHLAIVVFDDVFSAGSWQKSPAFKALSDELAKEGTLQVAAAGGIADPGAPPAVPMASLGPTPGRNRLPEIPKIADICKGCLGMPDVWSGSAKRDGYVEAGSRGFRDGVGGRCRGRLQHWGGGAGPEWIHGRFVTQTRRPGRP